MKGEHPLAQSGVSPPHEPALPLHNCEKGHGGTWLPSSPRVSTRFQNPSSGSYLGVAARRNSVSSLCLAQVPKPRSAARPNPTHEPSNNFSTGLSSMFGPTSATTMPHKPKTTQGRTRMRPTLVAVARVGFLAVSPSHIPTQ